MEQLLQRDLEAILNFLKELYASTTSGDFSDRLVRNLARLLPCDLATYNEMDPANHTSVDCGDPPGIMTPKLGECWRSVMHEHPVLMHRRQTGDLRARLISDFYSPEEFHRRALYHEFYRKFSVEDVLCNGIQVRGPLVIGCSFSRDRRSFTAKDCLTLDLIGPHLTQAWLNARAVSRLARNMELMATAVEGLNCGLVALNRGGRPSINDPVGQKRSRRIL